MTCAPSSVNVWALDQSGRVYVRSDVTDELPVGKMWQEVEGLSLHVDGCVVIESEMKIEKEFLKNLFLSSSHFNYGVDIYVL